MADNQLLVTYSVLNSVYKNGSLRFIRGVQDALSSTPTVGTIDNSRKTGVPLLSTDPDPKVFSFVGSDGGVRVLLSKVVSPVSGVAPFTTWTLLGASPAGSWATLAKDIVLATPGVKNQVVATNSYGVAQVGNWLYIVDYDSQRIYPLGIDELNGLLPGTFHTLTQAPLDLSANLPADAKGQAIIALQNGGTNYLFALYINYSSSYVHSAGALVRLTVNADGTLTYGAQAAMGLNPQEIVPLTLTNGTTYLVIPCVGGDQQAGSSNGILSKIVRVPAFGTFTPTDLVTGDASGTYDLFNIAGPSRAGDGGVVYLLAHDYSAGYETDWMLYKTTVSGLLTQTGGTLSDAEFDESDFGTDAPGYFWNILYENGDTAENDRLWFFEGSALLVTPALAYAPAPQTGVTNRYFPTGTADDQIGGENVDWADLTIETVRQAAAGVSLKRSVQAQKAPAPKAEGEEEK
jgi:hypothetical protein